MGLELQKCIYCGLRYSTKKGDHVPPQSFFPEPRGFSLIQVPCCLICNGEFSKVDDIVRDYLSGEIRNEKHSTVINHVSKKRNRSWDRNPAKVEAFSKNTSPFPEKVLLDGKVLEGHAMNLNIPEFHVFFKRIALSLLWEEFKIRSYEEKFEWQTVESLNEDAQEGFIAMINTGVFRSIGNNEFQYKGNHVANSAKSIWWVRFYEGTEIALFLT